MLNVSSLVKNTVSLLFCAVISACAYSPQQLNIAPKVLMNDEAYGQGRVLTVIVEDARDNKVLGSRGGAYPDTSVITIANDVEEAIAGTTRSILRQQGFVSDENMASVANVKIVLEQLGYVNEKAKLTTEIRLTAVIRLEINAADQVYSGRYRSVNNQQFALTPNAEANEEFVNKILAELLERAFKDPKVKVFLSNT